MHVTRLTSMGQLSSALAHELNQPLTATLNYINAARRVAGADPSKQSAKLAELARKGLGPDRARRSDHPALARFRGEARKPPAALKTSMR